MVVVIFAVMAQFYTYVSDEIADDANNEDDKLLLNGAVHETED